jgi:hypothetical protein
MTEFTDNRYKLEIDPKKMELWEIEVMQSAQIGNGMLIFCRYLSNGNGLISPNLPSEPIDELPRAELARIKNSEAYKIIRRWTGPQLEAAMSEINKSAGF